MKNYTKYILIGIVILIVGVLIAFFLFQSPKNEEIDEEEILNPIAQLNKYNIMIDFDEATYEGSFDGEELTLINVETNEEIKTSNLYKVFTDYLSEKKVYLMEEFDETVRLKDLIANDESLQKIFTRTNQVRCDFIVDNYIITDIDCENENNYFFISFTEIE